VCVCLFLFPTVQPTGGVVESRIVYEEGWVGLSSGEDVRRRLAARRRKQMMYRDSTGLSWRVAGNAPRAPPAYVCERQCKKRGRPRGRNPRNFVKMHQGSRD
jgi:hypothetical protein